MKDYHDMLNSLKNKVVDAAGKAGETVTNAANKVVSDEMRDKVAGADRAACESAIKDVEAQVKGENKEAIDKSVEALMAAAQKIGEKLNKAAAAQQQSAGAQQAQGNAGASSSSKPEDDVVDADYKEVKH